MNCITMITMIATIGLRSIIPVFGMIRRIGSTIGSVTRWSTWNNGLDWSMGNQLSSERAITAHMRMLRNVRVNWAT